MYNSTGQGQQPEALTCIVVNCLQEQEMSMPLGVMPAAESSGMHRDQLSAGKRIVYAARRHAGSRKLRDQLSARKRIVYADGRHASSLKLWHA